MGGRVERRFRRHLDHARCPVDRSRWDPCRCADPFSTEGWIEHLEPTQTFYSYVMNNYWETNYKASQEGMTTFRYSIMPHLQYDQAAAARFAIERSQPLLVRPARPRAPGA